VFRKIPPVEYELNFEYVLYHHLIVFSESYANGQCSFDEMVRMYEQYSTPQLTKREREILRKYKLVMSEFFEILSDYYANMLEKTENMEARARVEEERESQMDELHRIYHEMLLRWLVACTRKVFKVGKEDVYREWEFFEDLRIELQSIFDDEVIDDVFNKYGVSELKEEEKEEEIEGRKLEKIKVEEE